MDFQQIRDFVNPAVAQATGLQEVENLAMPVPVAYVPVQLVIDGALSLTSENPVQNKVIAVAIQQLDGRITAIEGQFSEGVTEAVNNWLAAHPEATTTVQDGAITYAKLDSNLKGEVDQISDLKNDINKAQQDINEIQSDVYDIISISDSDFDYGFIENNGSYRQGTHGSDTLANIATPLLLAKQGVIISPLTTNTIFKVALFDASGTLISVSGWMGKEVTGYATVAVESYTINAPYCRIAMANNYTGAPSVTIEEQLQRYNITPVKESKIGTDDRITLPFTFDFGANIYKKNGQYYTDFKPQNKAITGENKVVVYMSPNGTDSNDGLTVITPKKTLGSALSVSNVGTIILLEGTYVSGVHYNGFQQVTTEINFIGIGNVIFDNGNNDPIYFYRSVYCENIHFKGGKIAAVVKYSTTDRTATFYKCKFSESKETNGLSVLGGIAYIVECEAFGNAFDGFNYHANTDVSPNIPNYALEVDCKSYGNGTIRLDQSDGQSSNGSTTHDNSFIVRVNGEYYACHGGIIADKDSHSANYGCRAGISTVTDAENYPDRLSNYWSSGATMYLYDCVSYGSKYDTAKIRNGIIVSNITYESNYSG